MSSFKCNPNNISEIVYDTRIVNDLNANKVFGSIHVPKPILKCKQNSCPQTYIKMARWENANNG